MNEHNAWLFIAEQFEKKDELNRYNRKGICLAINQLFLVDRISLQVHNIMCYQLELYAIANNKPTTEYWFRLNDYDSDAKRAALARQFATDVAD